jgi:hypothetical protein
MSKAMSSSRRPQCPGGPTARTGDTPYLRTVQVPLRDGVTEGGVLCPAERAYVAREAKDLLFAEVNLYDICSSNNGDPSVA